MYMHIKGQQQMSSLAEQVHFMSCVQHASLTSKFVTDVCVATAC